MSRESRERAYIRNVANFFLALESILANHPRARTAILNYASPSFERALSDLRDEGLRLSQSNSLANRVVSSDPGGVTDANS